MAKIHRRIFKKELRDDLLTMIFYLVPDILECKVKGTLGTITTNKASRGVGIPAELLS